MSKKTPPLSDDSVIARATFLMMLDDLDRCADLIEGSKNASERAEAVACLRSIISNVKKGNARSGAVVYVSAHEKGRNSSHQNARDARHKPSKILDEYLKTHWFSIGEKKPPQKTFVQEHYPIFCMQAYKTDADVNDNKKKIKPITEKQFKKRLSPSLRRKPVAP